MLNDLSDKDLKKELSKLEKVKDVMAKTVKEAPKYLVNSDKRTYVSKGWGYEDWIWNDEKYCGKKLFFKKGKKCSFHYHKIKDEVLYLDYGKILLKFSEGDNLENACEIVLNEGDAFHVVPGLRHQMIGMLDSLITEVSTQHFDEDSIRVVKGD